MRYINNYLKKMILKCEEQDLKYCLYKLPSILLKHDKKPNAVFTQIKPNDKKLYIMKKEEIYDEKESEDKNEDNNKNDDKNNYEKNNERDNKDNVKCENYKIKRNYFSMMLDSIVLEEINLDKNSRIREFYNFYCEKFKLEKLPIYFDNKIYEFDKFKIVAAHLNCFGIKNNNNENDNNILYYEDKLCVFDINEKQERELDNEYKSMTYQVYFVGNKSSINLTLVKTLMRMGNSTSKLKKE